MKAEAMLDPEAGTWVCPLSILKQVHLRLDRSCAKSRSDSLGLKKGLLPSWTTPSFGKPASPPPPPAPTLSSSHAVDQRLIWPFPTVRLLAPWEGGTMDMVASQLKAVSSTRAPHALVFAGWPSNPGSKPSQLLEAASSPTDHW